MKNKTELKKYSGQKLSPFKLVAKGLLLCALILTAIQAPLQAQDTYTRPSVFFGVSAGANLNYFRGTTQELNGDLFVPKAFLHGNGLGLFLAPTLEFYRPGSRWGFMLQAGYDGRSGSFDQVTTPCNCPADLDVRLSYLTVEPSLRLAPFKGNFYLFAGPRLAFNLDKSFTYKLGINPLFPDQAPTEDVTADFSEVESMLISMQIGAGYDIYLSSQNKRTQWVLSPFVSFHPYMGQNPRAIETWTMTTVRAGAAIKFGSGKKIEKPVAEQKPVPVIVAEPEVKFTVNAPANLPEQRKVSATFPILNYIFFDENSKEVPSRYVMLNKAQVAEFKEVQFAGRTAREMDVYYNVINIVGYRMNRYPSANIRLTGSNLKGAKEGKDMAETVKNYLVSVFGIAPARITTEGSLRPVLSSETKSGSQEVTLLRQEDNRVTIWSQSPEMIKEFTAGAVELVKVAPQSSYVTFNAEGADEAYKTWSLDIKDDKGVVQHFGPFTGESTSIPGASILGTKTHGHYKVTLIGETLSGKTVKKEGDFTAKLWTPSELEPALRYSVIYEFDEREVTPTYVRYLTEVVAPQIPVNAQVNLSGYTDIIGDADNNQQLSLARANDVKVIIEKALAKAGRTDVKFVAKGFGENDNLSPFANKHPEERFYNRCVIIDIIPQK